MYQCAQRKRWFEILPRRATTTVCDNASGCPARVGVVGPTRATRVSLGGEGKALKIGEPLFASSVVGILQRKARRFGAIETGLVRRVID